MTSWYWTTGDPALPVSRQQLKSALFEGDNHRADLVAVLDRNGDGQLTGNELKLDSAAAIDAVRDRLQQSGLNGIELRSEITPFSISHNVVNGQWATRECATCHSADSVLAAPFILADYQPGNMLPQA